MKKLFIDCDVLLDVGLGQEPFCKDSGQLIDYLETKPNSGFIASVGWLGAKRKPT